MLTRDPERVLFHDFGGYAFPAELARVLAAKGTQVTLVYSSDAVVGKGRLEVEVDDPESLSIEGIRPPKARLVRYSPIGRIKFERAYARELIRAIADFRPDVVVVSNTDLFILGPLARYLRKSGTPWVLWHQDIVSIAIGHEAQRKLPRPLGRLVAWLATRMEKSTIKSADHIVPISDHFIDQYRGWDLKGLAVTVIPNWAPIDEIYPVDRDNQWAAVNGLDRTHVRLLYAGTLGRKHNPLLLVDILDRCRGAGIDAELIVISEGDGADVLQTVGSTRSDIKVLPYQPVADLRDVLGSCDVAIAQLEPEASAFSVPSKVLSYLAAGRPTLILAPLENPASVTVVAAGGLAVVPTDEGAETAAGWIVRVSTDAVWWAEVSAAARNYAEENFNVAIVRDSFVGIFQSLFNEASAGD